LANGFIIDRTLRLPTGEVRMSEAALANVPLQPGLLAIAAALLGIASLKDIAVRTIPDAVSLGLLAIGVAIRVADGNELSALVASSAVFVMTALCWRCGWLGGGDVKLVTACAWLVPPSLVPTLVLTTAVVGGVLACLYLSLSWMGRMTSARICSLRPHSLAGRIWRVERWRISRHAGLPYGCAIAVATLLTLSGR
jgi:prepilin peptidase CpaA